MTLDGTSDQAKSVKSRVNLLCSKLLSNIVTSYPTDGTSLCERKVRRGEEQRLILKRIENALED
jgi:hypothetical protein